VPTAALYSQTVAHVINFYLEEGRTNVRDEIARLVASNEEEALAKVMDYVYEALRKLTCINRCPTNANTSAYL